MVKGLRKKNMLNFWKVGKYAWEIRKDDSKTGQNGLKSGIDGRTIKYERNSQIGGRKVGAESWKAM